jgi:hypothetical protein
LISALLKDSKARKIIFSSRFTFVSPDYIHEEINKYKEYIAEKAGISKTELEDAVIA